MNYFVVVFILIYHLTDSYNIGNDIQYVNYRAGSARRNESVNLRGRDDAAIWTGACRVL